MSFNKTDAIVLPVIFIVLGIGGYLLYRNDINSEGKSEFEPIGDTINSIYQNVTNKMTYGGGSATKRHKKHRRNKSHKKH